MSILAAIASNPFAQMVAVIVIANAVIFGTLWVRGDWR